MYITMYNYHAPILWRVVAAIELGVWICYCCKFGTVKVVQLAKMHSKQSLLKYFIHFVLILNITIPVESEFQVKILNFLSERCEN